MITIRRTPAITWIDFEGSPCAWVYDNGRITTVEGNPGLTVETFAVIVEESNARIEETEARRRAEFLRAVDRNLAELTETPIPYTLTENAAQ